MFSEPTPEQEEELIDKTARAIVKHRMESAAVLLLETFKPISWAAAYGGIMVFTPWTMMLGNVLGRDALGQQGYNVMAFFKKRDNVERLIQRIEDLVEELKQKEKKEKRRKVERNTPN
jgi:hypothetical protein